MFLSYFLPFVLWACLGQATLTPRKPFDTAFYVFNGAWPCSQDQLKTISGAIDEAHDLAKAAINVLSKTGSEQSIAFDSWFGSSMSPSYKYGNYSYNSLKAAGLRIEETSSLIGTSKRFWRIWYHPLPPPNFDSRTARS